MKVKLKWSYAEAEYDTKDMKLICVKARGKRAFGPPEQDADLCIKNGMNLVIAEIHMGDIESSNALCEEIVRRFNEFPEELKR